MAIEQKEQLSVDNKLDTQKIYDILEEQKEKYKNNKEILEKINDIEKDLRKYLEKYNEISNLSDLSETISKEKKEKISDDLTEKLQKKILIEKIKSKIANLEIELKILEAKKEKNKRYDGIKKTYEKIKEIDEFKDIIGKKKFEDLTAGDFYAMLKTNPDKVKGLLLSLESGKKFDSSKSWDNYIGKVLKVNFGKNKGLDRIIGAGDILDITKVKSVKINGVTGTRKAYPRPGYYTNSGHYLAIHDGYKIEITEVKDLLGEELKKFNESKNKRFDEIRGGEIKINLSNLINKKIEENKQAQEIEIPYKAKVDKDFIDRFIKSDENKYLGIKIEDNKIIMGDNFTIYHLQEALSSYSKTKEKIEKYLENNPDLKNQKTADIVLQDLGIENEDFANVAFNKIIGNSKVKIKVVDGILHIDTKEVNINIGEIFSTSYEYHGRRYTHEKYKNEIESASNKYGVPSGAIIQLIYHENGGWNPRLKVPGSSAFGLGQMIDETWTRFGEGNRYDPASQLMATAHYMRYIKDKKNCSWEEVLAYYNTGLGIMKVSNINLYYDLNPAIARKQPAGENKTNKNYFISAVAYYNDLDFYTAKDKVKTL